MKDEPFDFRAQIVKYCRNDVVLLREACEKFRKLFIVTTYGWMRLKVDPTTGETKPETIPGVDPFSHVTVASLCMGVYRHMLYEEDWMVVLAKEKEVVELENRKPVWIPAKLKDKGAMFIEGGDGGWVPAPEIALKKFIRAPIAKLPAGGHGGRDNFSRVSIEWLTWEEHRRGVNIQHGMKPGGEVKIPNGRNGFYKLDGACDKVHVAWEFLGCAFHGCKVCYPVNRSARFAGDTHVLKHPYNNTPMAALYARTMHKKTYLKRLGYKYILIWECEWERKKRNAPEILSVNSTFSHV